MARYFHGLDWFGAVFSRGLAAGLAVTLVVSVSITNVQADSLEFTATGPGVELWSDISNWTPSSFPGLSDDVVINGPVVSQVDGFFSINSLTLASGNELIILDENNELVLNADSANNGLIHLTGDGGGINGRLVIDGNVRIDGTGEIRFSHFDSNQIEGTAGASLTIGATQTIRTDTSDVPDPSGSIGIALNNEGLVDADGGMIFLTNNDVSNTGTLRASNGGTLFIGNNTINNAGGLIDVQAGATLTMANDTDIQGGTIFVGGQLDASGDNIIIDVTGAGIQLDGELDLSGDGIIIDVTGAGIQGAGTINVSGSADLIGDNILIDVTGGGIQAGGRLGLAGNNILIDVTDGGVMQNDGLLDITGNDIIIDVTGSGIQGSGTVDVSGSNILIDVTDGGIQSGVSYQTSNGGQLTLRGDFNNTGTLVANGNMAIDVGSSLTNAENGVVTGNGTLNLNGATLLNLGTLTAGQSPGALLLQNADVDNDLSSITLFEIASEGGLVTQGIGYDFLEVDGDFEIDGLLSLVLLDGFVPSVSDEYTLLTALSYTGLADDFLNVSGGTGNFGFGTADVSLVSNNLIISNIQVSSVPVPATVWLFSSGLLGLFGVGRRKVRA